MVSGEALIPRLAELYQNIDSTYEAVVDEVGFSCGGCDGVLCCTVDLSLHTLIEMLYLRRGLNSLGTSRQQTILQRCRQMVQDKQEDPRGTAYRSAVCALNFEGLCSLYEFRPMICRLAGVPHLIARPDATTVESGGCVRYENEILPQYPGTRIDRTQFYRDMAAIEMEIVRHRGSRTEARTIAEALGDDSLENLYP